MDGQYLAVRAGDGVRRVDFREILYLTRRGRKILLETDEGEISYYQDYQYVLSLLDERFIPALGSCHLNADRIKLMRQGSVVFDNGREMRLSRDSFSRAKNAFYDYIKTHEALKNILRAT